MTHCCKVCDQIYLKIEFYQSVIDKYPDELELITVAQVQLFTLTELLD